MDVLTQIDQNGKIYDIGANAENVISDSNSYLSNESSVANASDVNTELNKISEATKTLKSNNDSLNQSLAQTNESLEWKQIVGTNGQTVINYPENARELIITISGNSGSNVIIYNFNIFTENLSKNMQNNFINGYYASNTAFGTCQIGVYNNTHSITLHTFINGSNDLLSSSTMVIRWR